MLTSYINSWKWIKMNRGLFSLSLLIVFIGLSAYSIVAVATSVTPTKTVNQSMDSENQSQVKPVLLIQHWQTKRQVPTFFVATRQIPMLIIHVIFTAGSAYDQNQWGLAALTANMLNQGTHNRNVDEIANQFSDSGAEFDASVDQDKTVVSLQTLTDPQYLNPALDVFMDVLTHPSFPKEGLERQKQQMAAIIKLNQQNPATVAMLRFYQTLYQQHPYAHPADGTLRTVTALTPKDVIHFYQQYYVAHNVSIVMVGDLKREKAEQIAENITNQLNLGQAAPSLPEPTPTAKKVKAYIEFPSKQTTLVLGQMGIARTDADFFTYYVGNFILGDLPLDSLLFQKVRREEGLAYGASSSFAPLLKRGPFIIELQTRTEKAKQALQITQNTLQQFLTDGPTESQLQLAKQLIINSFPIGLSTNEKIAAVLVNMVFYHRPLDYLDTYRSHVQAVTVDDIKKAFAQLIHPAQMITVIVGAKDPKTVNNLQN